MPAPFPRSRLLPGASAGETAECSLAHLFWTEKEFYFLLDFLPRKIDGRFGYDDGLVSNRFDHAVIGSHEHSFLYRVAFPVWSLNEGMIAVPSPHNAQNLHIAQLIALKRRHVQLSFPFDRLCQCLERIPSTFGIIGISIGCLCHGR